MFKSKSSSNFTIYLIGFIKFNGYETVPWYIIYLYEDHAMCNVLLL